MEKLKLWKWMQTEDPVQIGGSVGRIIYITLAHSLFKAETCLFFSLGFMVDRELMKSLEKRNR